LVLFSPSLRAESLPFREKKTLRSTKFEVNLKGPPLPVIEEVGIHAARHSSTNESSKLDTVGRHQVCGNLVKGSLDQSGAYPRPVAHGDRRSGIVIVLKARIFVNGPNEQVGRYHVWFLSQHYFPPSKKATVAIATDGMMAGIVPCPVSVLRHRGSCGEISGSFPLFIILFSPNHSTQGPSLRCHRQLAGNGGSYEPRPECQTYALASAPAMPLAIRTTCDCQTYGVFILIRRTATIGILLPRLRHNGFRGATGMKKLTFEFPLLAKYLITWTLGDRPPPDRMLLLNVLVGSASGPASFQGRGKSPRVMCLRRVKLGKERVKVYTTYLKEPKRNRSNMGVVRYTNHFAR